MWGGGHGHTQPVSPSAEIHSFLLFTLHQLELLRPIYKMICMVDEQ